MKSVQRFEVEASNRFLDQGLGVSRRTKPQQECYTECNDMGWVAYCGGARAWRSGGGLTLSGWWFQFAHRVPIPTQECCSATAAMKQKDAKAFARAERDRAG